MGRLNKIAEIIVIAFGVIIGLILVLQKNLNDYDSKLDLYELNITDTMIGCLLYMFLFMILIFVSNKFIISEKKYIGLNITITILFEIVFCVFLIWGSKIYFRSESGAVYDLAIRFVNNDYSAVIPTGSYLAIHPQQYGIIFILEVIMRMLNVKNGLIFQLMNIFLLVCSTLATYGIIWKINSKKTALTAYSIFQITFLPLMLYVPVAYGDLPSTCLILISVYFIIKIFENTKFMIMWMILATGTITLSCMFKKNSLVCLVAIILSVIAILLKRCDIRKFLWIMITACLAIASVPSIQKFYEWRADSESGKGIPMVAYISLSMQEGLGAPGAWSGYHGNLFLSNNYDHDATKKQAIEDIKNSISNFIDNPEYMRDFYIEKIAYQWTEATFDGVGWGVGNAFVGDVSPFVDNIQNGYMNIVIGVVANWHQSVVYLSFLIGMILCIIDIKKKREMKIGKMLLITMLIGGFLFELIWESSARYVMIYYTMMIPIASDAIARIYNIKDEIQSD